MKAFRRRRRRSRRNQLHASDNGSFPELDREQTCTTDDPATDWVEEAEEVVPAAVGVSSRGNRLVQSLYRLGGCVACHNKPRDVQFEQLVQSSFSYPYHRPGDKNIDDSFDVLEETLQDPEPLILSPLAESDDDDDHQGGEIRQSKSSPSVTEDYSSSFYMSDDNDSSESSGLPQDSSLSGGGVEEAGDKKGRKDGTSHSPNNRIGIRPFTIPAGDESELDPFYLQGTASTRSISGTYYRVLQLEENIVVTTTGGYEQEDEKELQAAAPPPKSSPPLFEYEEEMPPPELYAMNANIGPQGTNDDTLPDDEVYLRDSEEDLIKSDAGVNGSDDLEEVDSPPTEEEDQSEKVAVERHNLSSKQAMPEPQQQSYELSDGNYPYPIPGIDEVSLTHDTREEFVMTDLSVSTVSSREFGEKEPRRNVRQSLGSSESDEEKKRDDANEDVAKRTQVKTSKPPPSYLPGTTLRAPTGSFDGSLSASSTSSSKVLELINKFEGKQAAEEAKPIGSPPKIPKQRTAPFNAALMYSTSRTDNQIENDDDRPSTPRSFFWRSHPTYGSSTLSKTKPDSMLDTSNSTTEPDDDSEDYVDPLVLRGSLRERRFL